MPSAALKLVRKTIMERLENSREVTKMVLERLILFSDDELERVHETSLKTLQEVGIKVVSKKVQNLLVENGAEVDSTSSIVKIPSSLVEEAIKKAPKKIVLCGCMHGAKDCSFCYFELKKEYEVKGKIISDKPVSILFLYEKNCDKLCREKKYQVEDITEGIYETELDFKARKKDLWFVVIENPQKNSAKVKVNIYSLHKNK